LRALAHTDGPEAVAAHIEYVFGHVPAEHHHEMIREILSALYERKNIVILEPRGAAKTTIGNTGLLSWLIAKYPNLRVGLISNTSTQSFDFSRAIRRTFEGNVRFRELWGDLVSPVKWTNMEWIREGSGLDGTKDVTMFAVGVDGATISKRFDLIFCDDILDEENTKTPEQRETVSNWFFKTLMPCLETDGVIVVVGTRWAADDLYEVLMRPREDGGNGWRSLVRSALLTDEEGNEYSYWPGHWPVSRLQELREELGSALFACAYQNDVSGLLAGNVFRREWFDYFTTLPQGHSYTTKIGVDLASSEKERADYTARVTTTQDMCDHACGQRGDFFIRSVYRDKRETGHAEFIADGWMAYPGVGLVIVENQQFQSTLVQEVMEDYPFIPVIGKPADRDKTTRARAVAAKYEAHKIHHHASLMKSAFEIELLSFPKGHDDMVDALGYSMDLGGDTFVFGSVRR